MRSQVRALPIALGLFCAASVFAQTAAPVAAKASTPVAVTASAAAKPVANAAVNPAAKVAAPAAAAGGGDGKVWVDTKSKVYYCEGSKSYGKTKVGEYMIDANTKGDHADHGKACSK